MDYKEILERRNKIYNKVDEGVDFGTMENTHELLLYMEGVDSFLPRVFEANKILREQREELIKKFERLDKLNNFFLEQLNESNKELSDALIYISDIKIQLGVIDEKAIGKLCKDVDALEDEIEGGEKPLRKVFYNLVSLFIRKKPRK